MTWYRDDRLVAIHIAELRAEADRDRLVNQGQSPNPVITTATAGVRVGAARLLAAAQQKAAEVTNLLDRTAGASEYPAGMFGGQSHSR